jgi:predicted ATPase
VVLVSGEPGIGKSRLTAALSERIESDPHTRLRSFCSPHYQDSALYPFIRAETHKAQLWGEQESKRRICSGPFMAGSLRASTLPI